MIPPIFDLRSIEETTTFEPNPSFFPINESSIIECREVHNISSVDRCHWVAGQSDCEVESFINYVTFMYCAFDPADQSIALIISIVWMLVLFIALGVAATDFLCPALFLISKTLNMSQNVAGVTLIAFGNGSPDIFAAIAGMMSGRPALVIGGLLGGATFITFAVIGTIFSVKSFKLLPKPFLRDIIFYIIASTWIFYLFIGPKAIDLYDAVGFLIFYAFYVILVICSRFWDKSHGKEAGAGIGHGHGGPAAKERNPNEPHEIVFEGISRDDDPTAGMVVMKGFMFMGDDLMSDKPPPGQRSTSTHRSTSGYRNNSSRQRSTSDQRSGGTLAGKRSNEGVTSIDQAIKRNGSLIKANEKYRYDKFRSDEIFRTGSERGASIKKGSNEETTIPAIKVVSGSFSDDADVQSDQDRTGDRKSDQKRNSIEVYSVPKESSYQNVSKRNVDSEVNSSMSNSTSSVISGPIRNSLISVSNSNQTVNDDLTYDTLTSGNTSKNPSILKNGKFKVSNYDRNLQTITSMSNELTVTSAKSVSIFGHDEGDDGLDDYNLTVPGQDDGRNSVYNTITSIFQLTDQQRLAVRRASKDFLEKITPIDMDGWKHKEWGGRSFEVIKAPIRLFLLLTTPMAEVENNHRWNKPLSVIHCIAGPLFVVYATGLGSKMIGEVLPLPVLVFIIAALISGGIIFTSKFETPPSYYKVYSAYLGFVIAVAWVYFICTEVVSVIRAIGIAFNLSEPTIGMTLLAWGNCLLDFISNVSIAKKGFPRMAVGACLGSPLLALLIGVGIPATIILAQRPSSVIHLHPDNLIVVIYIALTCCLLFIVTSTGIFKFVVKRPVGFILISAYAVLMVIIGLVEWRVIPVHFVQNSN